MVILLVRNVFPDRGSGRGTHRKRGISLLPLKMLCRHRRGDPNRGRFLELPHEVRQAVRRIQGNQQMDVVGYAANALGHAIQTADRSAQVFVKPGPPVAGNQTLSILGGKYKMVVKAGVRRRHNPRLAPHPGCRDWIFFPVVSQTTLNHRLQAAIPPGIKDGRLTLS
jgi:hypothetical protein